MITLLDAKSVIGPVPMTPCVIAAVPGYAGYTLGPLCGRVAAEMALGVPPAIDARPYSPARFSA